MATPSINMSETASAVMTVGGTPETVVFANQTNSSGPVTSVWQYGCIRDSTTICDMDQTYSDVGNDPSLIVGGGYMYAGRLRTTSGSQGWYLGRSSDPCPSGCAFNPWSICSVSGVIDWARLVKADSTTAWAVYNDFASPTTAVAIAKVTWCSAVNLFPIVSQCSNLAGASIRNPHAVVGGSGIIHVVFADTEFMRIKYTQFNTTNNTWNCTLKDVGAINNPPRTCAGSSKKVFSKLGNLNLEYTPQAQIARDSASGALVVVWERYDSAADILGGTAARSGDGGATWNVTLGTAMEAAHNAVACGSGHRFEIGQTYNSTSNQGAQVRWKSTDAGQTWSGIFVSSSRSLAPKPLGIRTCYWGDYEAVSWHSTNDAFYHAWMDVNQGSDSVVRGLFSTN